MKIAFTGKDMEQPDTHCAQQWEERDHPQIKGAVYNSRPIPQLKQARLKLSDAKPFSFSVNDVYFKG